MSAPVVPDRVTPDRASPAAPYDALAAAYETPAARTLYGTAAAKLAEVVPPQTEGPALDLGCGTGLSTEVLAAARPRLTWQGLDASPAMLAVARAKPALAAVALEVGRAEALPFAGGTFSGVACNVAFHWFEAEAVAELTRVVRPGGWAALVVPARRPAGALEGNQRLRRVLLSLRGAIRPARAQGLEPGELDASFGGWTCEVAPVSFVLDEEFPTAETWVGALRARGALSAVFGSAADRAAALLAAGAPGPVAFRWTFLSARYGRP